ncbi:MAG: MinD/ParA family protein [Candidatus Marinimicrobia bacterium]|nr:MinD/ParA family protein [Candidatus Neomarinimicrobiota bacterium]
MLEPRTTPSIFALSNLRVENNRPEIFAITSGKGGVGKTNISVNLALLLRRLKKNVLLVDADIHLGNVDLMLGIRPGATLADVISGEKALAEIIVKGPTGIDVMPASSAVLDMIDAEEKVIKRLGDAFLNFEHNYDLVIVDTGAGIGRNVTSFSLGADKVIVVVTPDPASIADAYGVIKILLQKAPNLPIMLVTNMVQSDDEGENLYKKMDLMVQRFLQNKILFGGAIVRDDSVQDAVRRQVPVVLEYPNSRPSNSLKMMTRNLLKLPSKDASERISLFDGVRENRNEIVGNINDQTSK